MGLSEGAEAGGRRRRRGRFHLGVRDEFEPLRAVLIHRPDQAVDTTVEQLHAMVPSEEIRDHPESGDSSGERALEQHEALRGVLERFGVTLLHPEPMPDSPCQVFTRDPCFVVGDDLYLSGMRDECRMGERHGLTELAESVRGVVDLGEDGRTIEGGDVMVLDRGRKVLVGRNRHTNDAGIEALRKRLEPKGVEVVAISHRGLHLDCCVAPLPDGDVLYCPSKMPEGSISSLRGHFRSIQMLDRQEAENHLAANLLWMDRKHVISNREAPRTNEMLRKRGYEVIELEFTDIVRLWGSFRCATCPLVRG